MLQALQDLGDYIGSLFSTDVASVVVSSAELTVSVQRQALIKVLTFLRDDANCQFRQLMFITGVDYPNREQRFEIVYHLLSIRHNQRVRIKVRTNETMPVPSAVALFPSANWFEREVWDMYGVAFTGHPDLRRLLTDYGFDGHPLRKDFPLTGYLEVRYNDECKRVVYEPVRLTQEFRSFDFLSPWEGYGITESSKDETEVGKISDGSN